MRGSNFIPGTIALAACLCLAGCGNATPGLPDGSLSCSSDTDCQDGYRCRDGRCVEGPSCTDFDGDGFCDEREGYDDCNDNRADIHPGAAEVCDGLDNDCDGLTDEDVPNCCSDGEERPCGTDIGACVKGVQRCQGGSWGPCQGGQQPADEEDCEDELDNDCNGAVNDGCACTEGDSRACGSNLGTCTPGVQECIEEQGEWHWGPCTGGTPAVDEICGDELDNDCDGSIDNGCPCEADSRPCGTNAGVCHVGTQTCSDGVWGACVGARMPDDEICDGLDNDCDHVTDEGCECLDGQFEACGTDVGECSMGSRHCVRGRWGPCEGEVPPSAEVCDGRDNDCDGEYDENYPDLMTACTAGQGICARPGAWVCSADGSHLVCSATPGTGTDEACNGLDDDCDGETDEDFAGLGEPCSRGQGECYAAGVTVCDPAGGYVCNAEVIQPSRELCDGLDNNCDGATDESFPLGQPCAAGVGECHSEGHYVCSAEGTEAVCDAQPLPAGSEECNGLDDDCDGRTDEELTQACSNACGNGVRYCIVGQWGECSAPPPEDEICDYADNDCDGDTDEGFDDLGAECQAGTGACLSQGYMVCSADGQGTVCNAVAGSPQGEGDNYTCQDGIDNDCDGATDGDDSDCDSGSCRNIALEDLYGLQFLAGGLGLGLFRRRRRRSARRQGGAA